MFSCSNTTDRDAAGNLDLDAHRTRHLYRQNISRQYYSGGSFGFLAEFTVPLMPKQIAVPPGSVNLYVTAKGTFGVSTHGCWQHRALAAKEFWMI